MSKREEYINKMAAQLKEWSARMDVLKAKAEKAEADAKINYDSELESLRKRKEAAEKRLSELKNASESAWEDLKDGCEKSWQEFKSALDTAVSKLK